MTAWSPLVAQFEPPWATTMSTLNFTPLIVRHEVLEAQLLWSIPYNPRKATQGTTPSGSFLNRLHNFLYRLLSNVWEYGAIWYPFLSLTSSVRWVLCGTDSTISFIDCFQMRENMGQCGILSFTDIFCAMGSFLNTFHNFLYRLLSNVWEYAGRGILSLSSVRWVLSWTDCTISFWDCCQVCENMQGIVSFHCLLWDGFFLEHIAQFPLQIAFKCVRTT
jgi:hypothetical protein